MIFINKYGIYILILLIALLYVNSISPDPIVGDSLAYTIQGMTKIDFDSNATNHLLFTSFLFTIHKIFPINPHLLFVYSSIFFGISYLYICYKFLIFKKITNKSALVVVSVLALSFTFYRQNVITEVYTFYLFFCILFYFYIEKFRMYKQTNYLILASFFLGITFLIHIQSILFLPFYFIFLINNFQKFKKEVLISFFIFIGLFSILLIPVTLNHNSLIEIFTDGKYEDSYNFEIKSILKSLLTNLSYFVYNFLFFSIPIIIGIFKIKDKKYFLLLLIPFFIFCIKHNVSDGYVFQLVPYLLLLYPLGLGLDYLMQFNYFKNQLLFIIFIGLFPVIQYFTTKIISTTNYGQNIEITKKYKGGIDYCFIPSLKNTSNIEDFITEYEKKTFKGDSYFEFLYNNALIWRKTKKK